MRKKRDFVFLRPVKWLGIGMMAALVVACEKPVLGAAPTPPDGGEANVVLHFCQYEQDFKTRAMTDITEICSRLNIAIFDGDGTKVTLPLDGGFALLKTISADGSRFTIRVTFADPS